MKTDIGQKFDFLYNLQSGGIPKYSRRELKEMNDRQIEDAYSDEMINTQFDSEITKMKIKQEAKEPLTPRQADDLFNKGDKIFWAIVAAVAILTITVWI